MLQARSAEGNLVTLATLSNIEVKKLKQEKFYCPTCKEQVIVKAGTKVIPHFAHRSILNCPAHKGGEGPYHEQGKLLLYQWLRRQNLQVEIEVFLPEINQQPDLLLKINDKRIAIEYQCARVSIDQIHLRNRGYEQAGIIPIWIMGANRLKRKARDQLKVDQYLLHFIHQFSSTYPLTLFYFCPLTFRFILVQDVYLATLGKAIGKFRIHQLDSIRLTDIFSQFSFSKNELYRLWKEEKKLFRLGPSKYKFGNELAWAKWLYLKGTHREFLPSAIHLPTSSQYLMNSPPWDWQSRLCLDILDKLPIGARVSLETCQLYLRKQLQQPSNFPLIQNDLTPIEEYLQHLSHLNIFVEQSPHSFIKVNSIEYHKNIEDALKEDITTMDQLGIQNPSMIQ